MGRLIRGALGSGFHACHRHCERSEAIHLSAVPAWHKMDRHDRFAVWK
jgi:hypothetical protein